MTSRINIFRKTICFMVVLVLVFSSLSFAVSAANSKTVTYETSYSFVIYSSQLNDYMSSPYSYVPATYNYNDGTYKGTLNITYAACGAPTSAGGIFLNVTIYTRYSGTVYGNEPKSITYETSYSFVIYSSQLNDYMSSPYSYVPATYDYYDGTYRGRLNITYAACGAPTSAGGNFLNVTIYTRYSGTVY